MPQNRTFRITDDDLDEVRARNCDQAMIDACVQWITKAEQLDPLIGKIEDAFAGLTLGDGIGLLEANGIDDYASKDELIKFRSRDERTDWRRIDVETLNGCYVAPTYMDARGFVFHLPAFLIAELNDDFSYGFIDRLISVCGNSADWIDLLNPAQRDVIISVLSLVAEHPNYYRDADEIAVAIERLREGAG